MALLAHGPYHEQPCVVPDVPDVPDVPSVSQKYPVRQTALPQAKHESLGQTLLSVELGESVAGSLVFGGGVVCGVAGPPHASFIAIMPRHESIAMAAVLIPLAIAVCTRSCISRPSDCYQGARWRSC